jgi:hypothetical protein
VSITEKQWQTLLGVIGVVTALLLAQTDVPLDPAIKLTLVIVAGVVAYLRPKGTDAVGE